MKRLPLLRGFDGDGVLAYHDGRTVRVSTFVEHVSVLAERLPQHGPVLNICRDRYRFCVGFAAALVRGQTSLMPPNQTPDLLERLQQLYPTLYRLTDADEVESTLPTLRFPALGTGKAPARPVPCIPCDHTASIMFTSGSTGVPVAHAKTWETLVASGSAEGERLGLTGRGTAVLGTVPAQHMYGLESTVLMPLQTGLALHGARPFYPADVARALEALPRPRALVSTPVHLRTLTLDGIALPPVDLIVCATAPLAPQLASRCEAAFSAPLHEIYGCTEAGQIATRRTVETAEWQTLPGLTLRQDEKGTWATGGHVAGEILLSDIIELKERGRFLLHGRNADLVNIAGKRTSLAHLNFHLNSIEGVIDGAFIVPDNADLGASRLMALVVAPGLTREALLRALRRRIDAAFMPRPLTLLSELPRNATGKLPLAALQALAADALLVST